jgi:lysophospholipase
MHLSKNKFILIISIIVFSACSENGFELLKVDSNSYKITTEKDLSNSSYVADIDSLFSSGIEGFFEGKNKVEIYYKYFLQSSRETEKGAILISDGRTEAVVKYKEMIYDLFKNGYSVYIHDHRGQGFSERMTQDSDMGFVDDFQNYIDDMKTFYDSILLPNKHRKVFLLAHSMGGAIGMLYLEQHPSDFNAAAFSSPMLGLPFPTCTFIGMLAGDEPEYAMGNTDYENGIEPFVENTLTNSEVRYVRMLEVFDQYPKARLGGASYQRVNKSCEAFDEIFNNYENVRTPFILFSGSEEVIVASSSHNEFVNKVIDNGLNANGYLVSGAKHELFIEKDISRNPVITKIFDFYSSF